MRLLNVLFVLILSVSVSLAQFSENFIQEDEQEALMSGNKKDIGQKKVFTNIAIGSSVMSSSKKEYSFSTYINPTISYQLTPRFTVSMGLMAVQSNLNNYSYYNYEGQIKTLNYSGLSAYYTLQGAYQLSEKIRVYGGVMLGTESMDFLGTNIPNSSENKHHPKAYQVGFEYKIGEHSSLNFEFQFRDATPMQNMQMQSVSGFGTMGHTNSMFGPRMW